MRPRSEVTQVVMLRSTLADGRPFGFALELARGDLPAERIPPGGNPA
jgi:hypothetical protein